MRIEKVSRKGRTLEASRGRQAESNRARAFVAANFRSDGYFFLILRLCFSGDFALPDRFLEEEVRIEEARFEVRFEVRVEVRVEDLRLPAFAATISYDCRIKSRNSFHGTASSRSSITHL
jgi:hypothetical protein